MGLHKNIESAEKLEEYFNTYELQTKSNPFLVQDYVGKDGDEVYRKKEKPLTMEGFECWLYEKGIISDLSHYFSNKDNRYSEFVAICSHIRKRIRQDQISGGMAGLYNPSITQRLNGLTDKSEVTVKEQPLFPDEV
jgi:hypothetical protein